MNEAPTTLGGAIAAEPLWLLIWLTLLGGTHFLSICFIAYRTGTGWRFRWEPVAILMSFFFAFAIMNAIYGAFGYVRLLGLGHLIGWLPIYAYLLYRRKTIGFSSLWGKYVHLYLLIAGISLVIDALDTLRFLLG